MKKREKRVAYILRAGMTVLTIILIILFFGIMSLVSDLQGTARVVNYAGLVRGETQRVIKLEVSKEPDDEMIATVEAIINGLRFGSDELDLVRLEDTEFQGKMDELAAYFTELKEGISKVRQKGYEQTAIIGMSENFFRMCDEVTGIAEGYSQKRATALNHLEKIVVADIVCLVLLIGVELLRALRCAAQNRILRKKIYLDESTGLPNKNKCEEILSDPTPLGEEESTAICVFDLNNLRIINNNLGHDKGDEYIRSFAEQLRLAVDPENFVGRDGGDEFIAIFQKTDHSKMRETLKKIRTQMENYSAKHPEMPISYAAGYAISLDFAGSTLRELFRLADKNMYVDKNRAKIEEAAQKQQKAYELLEWIKKEKYHFSDCLYCDALMDQYEILRSSTGYFLAEDGNYSGAVEQIVEELATDRVRKEFWETLQLTSLEQQLTKDNPQLEIPYRYKRENVVHRGRVILRFLDATEDGRLHHFILGQENFRDSRQHLMDEKQELIRYYEQMKQSILENSNYVDALMETAEAVYTVDLTNDCLENAFYHVKRESIIIDREMPCSYDAYCRERSQKVTDDTLESYRIMDSSEKLLKRFREGDKQITVEYREEKQDGRMIWLQKTILMSRELLYDRETGKEHSAVHGIILFKNTSEFHKKEEEEKERLQKAVQEADAESKAKTDFMNRMSHDIRTPLNGIMGMLEILRKNEHNPEKMEECMNKIQVSADHLLALVNDVLDMNKLETNQIQAENEPFDLEVLMQEVAALMNPLLEQNRITHRVHRKNIQHTALKGSPLQLRQIMLNLFSNAVKYNKPLGSVDTYAEEVSCDGKTAWYEFRIADTGIGMSGDFVKNQLFEPFTQEQYGARTRYQGTGLGMSIVKGLVEKMGGTIQVESVRGEGTTFTFRLPFTVNETAASETNTAGEDISDLLRDRSILLVEDNEINMEIAQFYLEEAGAKVEKAWNGQEAVALFFQKPAGSFDAILMDVMMPVMDGMEATQRIRDLKREDAASIPIIAMTAQTTADIRETCRKAGMDDYIAKPIREEELAKVIRKSWKAKKV